MTIRLFCITLQLISTDGISQVLAYTQ